MLYQRALAIKAKRLGSNHPSYEVTAKNLAMVRRAAKQRAVFSPSARSNRDSSR